MKREILVSGLLAMGMVLAPAAAFAENDHDNRQEQHDAGTEKLMLDDGAKWKTDEPLRRGMAAIRDEIADVWPSLRKYGNEFPKDEYMALAGRVEGHLAYIVENCNLAPSADAQFHILLTRMYEGVAEMREDEMPLVGAVRVMKAVDAYPEFFDHHDWVPMAR